MPYRLSAFADEISPDIQVQLDHLLENGVHFCCLRGANGKNVMEFEDFQIPLIKQQFHNRGVHFSAIGSPIGKTQITDPFEPELERLRRAAALAEAFETRCIRIFTFYLPKNEEPAKYRHEVLRRMKALSELAEKLRVSLAVENEKGIYADNAARHKEIIEHVNAPHVKAIFDFSNYIECNQDPWEAWQLLKPHTVEFHIKDCRKADKKVVAAGQGDGRIADILKDAFASGWKGYLTLEPHLSASGQFSGFSGPQLFKTAVDGLKQVLKQIDR